MKTYFAAGVWLVCVCALGACGHGHSHSWQAKSYKHYQPGDGAIDLAAGEVVIRAGGQPEDAHVDAAGELRLGRRPIETSAEGREALRQYYADAAAFREHAVALSMAGAHFGVLTAGHVLKGLFDGGVEKAGEEAGKGGEEIVQRALELCDRFGDAYRAQNLAAAAVPEFKPYAVISERQVQECRDQGKPDSSDGSPSVSKSDSQA